MITNYLKTAIRNLVRYKGFAIINILSLTIGIVGCLVIGLFVFDEKKYDQFPGGDTIFRIYNKRNTEGGITSSPMVPPSFAPFAKQQFPEVAQTARVYNIYGKSLVSFNSKKIFIDKGLLAENAFFEFFPLEFKYGSPTKALTDKNTIVLGEKMARQYFGDTDPVGKIMTLETDPVMVTGVLKNVPEHFHLDFNYLLSFSSLEVAPERLESWTWQQIFTYIRLRDGTDPIAFEKKFQAAVKAKSDPVTDKSGFRYLPFLQPLKQIHLYSSNMQWDVAKRGNITYVNALTIIAIFVLVIACFNFINLATARSFRRAKEIGVRKVIGAGRSQLIMQFMLETVLLAVIAVLLAGIITMMLLPLVNQFTEKAIRFNPLTDPWILPTLLLAGFIIGVLAGIYPSLILSGFEPIKVLKGIKITNGTFSQHVLRQGLVVLQFTLSALLIICTVIVYRQVKFLHQKDLGFNKDQLITFELRGEAAQHPDALKADILQSSDVIAATAGYGLPGDIFAGDEVTVPKDGGKAYPTTLFLVDEDYMNTLNLQLVSGRNFSKEMPTDKDMAFIINETAVKTFGFQSPEKALGQELHWNKWENDSINPVKKGRVVGVIRDFHFKSLHDKVGVMVLQMYPEYYKMAVKVKAENTEAALAHIRTAWKKYVPDPLEYSFMDESFARMYRAEDKLGTLLLIFTGMAIFIGSMGLFALAAFSAEQRVKEIGIRKVLGASVLSISSMLSYGFIKLVVLASLLSFPIAWYAMDQWLQDFSYRQPISWWIFPVSSLGALFIALATVSFHAIRAALANPVHSLRSE